jgi:hypothetical protein
LGDEVKIELDLEFIEPGDAAADAANDTVAADTRA